MTHANNSGRVESKVYLIDDDPVITFLLVDLVESIGLPYAVFTDAASFVQTVKKLLETPVLLFAD